MCHGVSSFEKFGKKLFQYIYYIRSYANNSPSDPNDKKSGSLQSREYQTHDPNDPIDDPIKKCLDHSKTLILSHVIQVIQKIHNFYINPKAINQYILHCIYTLKFLKGF